MEKLRIASVREIMSTRARATYSHRVNFQTVGYTTVHDMNRWCEDHCSGLWRSETVHAVYWQFELERDALVFTLKWATAQGNILK